MINTCSNFSSIFIIRYLIINADATFRILGLFSNAIIVKPLPKIPVHMISNVTNAAAFIMFWFFLDHLYINNNTIRFI